MIKYHFMKKEKLKDIPIVGFMGPQVLFLIEAASIVGLIVL